MFIGGMDMRLRNYGAGSPLAGFFVNFWRMDDLADAIGAGTLTNSSPNPVTFSAGKIGNAGNFVTAENRYLTVAGDYFHVSQAKTVSMWINPTAASLATQHGFLSVAGPNDPKSGGPAIIFTTGHAANKISIFQAGIYWNGSTSLVAGSWYHVFYVYQASGQTDVYLNGNTTPEITGLIGESAATRTNLYIGSGFNATFDGQIDAVGYSNNAGNLLQLAASYNLGNGSEPPF